MLLRLQSQVQQHDPLFSLRHLYEALPLDTIQSHLNKSTKSLRNIQRESSSHRTLNLYELLDRKVSFPR